MGIKERKEREKEQRRADIISSARAAFVKYGIEHTTMDRIAAEAELSKGTLYLYYRNRDELLMSIMGEDLEHLSNRIADVATKPWTASRRLLASFGTFYDYSLQNEFMYRMMTQVNIRSLFETDNTCEPVCHFRDVNTRIMALVTSILDDGVNAGEFIVSQPLQHVVVQMMVAMKGAMVMLRNEMLPPAWLTQSQAETLHSIACLFVRGLSSPTALPLCNNLFGDPARPLSNETSLPQDKS